MVSNLCETLEDPSTGRVEDWILVPCYSKMSAGTRKDNNVWEFVEIKNLNATADHLN